MLNCSRSRNIYKLRTVFCAFYLLFIGTLGTNQQPRKAIAQSNVLEQAIQAVVRIRGCNAAGCNVGLGSGTLIHPSGVILTAYHVTLTDANNPLSPRHNDFVIELTENARSVPVVRYRAQLIAANVNADLALLRIYQDERTGQSITPTSGLDLSFLPLADVDTVRIGESLHILGYPQAGGARINYTSEDLSGFDGNDGSLLKIQKALSEGNSGGPALVVREEGYEIAGVVIRRRGEVGEISLMRAVDQLSGLTWEPQVYQVWADQIALQVQATDDGPMVRVDLTLHMLDFADAEGQLLVYGFTMDRRPLSATNGNTTGTVAKQVVFGEPFTGQTPIESRRHSLQIPLSDVGVPPEQVHWQIVLWDVKHGRLLWEGQQWLEAAPIALAAAPTPVPTEIAQPTATATPPPSPTPTNTPLPTATNTPQPTASAPPQPTATETPFPTFTPTITPRPTATRTPAPTATPSDPTALSDSELYEGPGTNYPVVGRVQAGEPLTIIGRSEGGGWYQLENAGWITAIGVKNAPPSNGLAVVAAPPVLAPNPTITAHTTAIAANPNDAAAYYNRGLTYRAQGEYDRAITDFGKRIEFDPNYAQAFYSRGRAHQLAGNEAEAIADFERYLELEPDGSFKDDVEKRIQELRP